MAKTTDELFAEATEADYETAEPVTLAASDTEEEFQFRIDEHLRTIAIPEKGVVAGVEGDLNVNIARFTMARYYHGRDLSKLNIRINYRNANGQVNYYTVSDATISGDSIVFSWEYAADVTQYKGNVQFVVYLFSATSAVLKQKFFTTLGTLEVLEGLEVDSSIPVSEQTDILLHLKKDLSAYAEEVKKSLPADYTAMTEQVNSLKEELKQLKQSGIVTNAAGEKYSIEINEAGEITAKRIYELPKDGLIYDLQIKEGAVVDAVNAGETMGYVVADDGTHFNGDFKRYSSATSAYDLLRGETLADYTVIAYLTGDGSNGGQIIAGNSNNDGICIAKMSNVLRLKYFNYVLPTGSNTTVGFANAIETVAKVGKKNLAKEGVDTIMMFGKNSEQKIIRTLLHGVVAEKEYSVENDGLYNLRLNSVSKFIRVAVYNRLLTDEEMLEAFNTFQYVDENKYSPYMYAQGIVGLGCPTAFYAKSGEYPEWDNSVTDYTEIEQTEATVNEDMSCFTDLFFINPISEIEIGKIYNIEAMVYPYNVLTTPYNVEYSTSDPEILECYSGVLIPKTAGTATITAKISNTEITVEQEITVIEAVKVEENYCYLSENYCYGVK